MIFSNFIFAFILPSLLAHKLPEEHSLAKLLMGSSLDLFAVFHQMNHVKYQQPIQQQQKRQKPQPASVKLTPSQRRKILKNFNQIKTDLMTLVVM